MNSQHPHSLTCGLENLDTKWLDQCKERLKNDIDLFFVRIGRMFYRVFLSVGEPNYILKVFSVLTRTQTTVHLPWLVGAVILSACINFKRRVRLGSC